MSEERKIDHIAELQKKLYTRDPEDLPQRRVGILRPIRSNVESTWGSQKPTIPKKQYKKSVSGYKKFFMFSIGFLVLTLLFLGYSLYRGSHTVSTKNVEVSILGNSFVPGGELLPIQIEVANKNSTELLAATLTIEYPKGSLDTSGSEVVRAKKELGTILPGTTKSESFDVVLYGEQGSTRIIKATLEYQLPNAITLFTKQATFPVAISSSPIALTVDALSNSPANQSFTLSVKTSVAADKIPENMALRIEYPIGFKFQSSDLTPAAGNNIWALNDLKKGTDQSVVVRGILTGQSADEKSFRIYIGERDEHNPTKLSVIYNSTLHTVTLDRPFIEAQISIGERASGVVALEREAPVSGSVRWRNSLPVQLNDAEITMLISGGGIDESSVVLSGGFYDSRRNAIVWNKDTALGFDVLSPGAQGSFNFSFKPLTALGGERPRDINLSISVKAKSSEDGFQERSVEVVDKVTVRFIGSINFTDTATHSTAVIDNTGPMPPRADQTTTYTITWTVRPGETKVNQAEATAKLPFYVGWNGIVVPSSESILFDPDTRTVLWKMGTIPQSVGTAKSRSVSFQVSLTPSRSQIGSTPVLLEGASIKGVDSATSALLQLARPPLTTRIENDPLYKNGNEIVTP